MVTRRQASLFLSNVPVVEDTRSRFNPVQAALIPAHVTLCREDEVCDWLAFEDRIRDILPIAVTLEFGSPVREANLVYLPVIGSAEPFDQLRFELLAVDGKSPRKQLPHVTIIHPRNGVCTDEIFDQVAKSITPFTTTFQEISLIEQTDGGVWNCFANFRNRE